MSALLGHADAARCMAKAFKAQAFDEPDPEPSDLLLSISRAYDRAAVLMLEENRRQVGATPHNDPNAV